jgi:hypothetical protein
MKRFLLMLVLICATVHVYAEEMNSTNFTIVSDSVNVGGVRSTSTSYNLEDTTGEVATGIGTSTNYTLKSGYQQMQTGDIALTPGSDVSMSPNIGGITGGTADGSYVFSVVTNNDAGYTATIRASSSPAMTSGANSIADYTPAGANPDFTFSVAAADSELAISVEGLDISSRYKDNGSTCNTGSGTTANTCWDPLTTSERTIVQRLSPNGPLGVDTTVKFRVGVGASRFQPEGVYVATTTITVLPL